ncbi:tetratricopeptide repeat protein [Halalkalibacterium ligniniphilum]|uniref:tetratricopeptide repeat protein n=1 Tax=Halalkalibacterium ligniniphilum TaxID=1134413 RepID=UPI0003488257|nr:tetratricopeptide repeat protein [Halalkalibacterium ligniniphilum]
MEQGWRGFVEQIKKSWEMLSERERKEALLLLEGWSSQLLDEWSDMNEVTANLAQRLAERKPFEPYVSRGSSLFDLELFAEAAQELESEVKALPTHSLLLLYSIYANLYAGLTDRCKERCLYVLHLTTEPVIRYFTYVALGCMHVQEGRLEEGISSFEHAESLTIHSDVLYNLGVCHYLNQSYELAKRYFIQVVDFEPEDAEAYYHLGCCYLALGEAGDAHESWLLALQLQESTTLLQAMAYLFEWYGLYQAAIHCYERLVSIGYEKQLAKHGMAWNYALMDRRKEALILFEELVEADSHVEEVQASIKCLAEQWGETTFQHLLVESAPYI